jgi:hypothetical protein
LLGATENVDAFDVDINNGNYAYRVGGLNTEATGDVVRTNVVSDFGYVDYNVGWFDNTSWGNYTRTYPAGTFGFAPRAGGK